MTFLQVALNGDRIDPAAPRTLTTSAAIVTVSSRPRRAPRHRPGFGGPTCGRGGGHPAIRRHHQRAGTSRIRHRLLGGQCSGTRRGTRNSHRPRGCNRPGRWHPRTRQRGARCGSGSADQASSGSDPPRRRCWSLRRGQAEGKPACGTDVRSGRMPTDKAPSASTSSPSSSGACRYRAG